jgi:hypothetical protein
VCKLCSGRLILCLNAFHFNSYVEFLFPFLVPSKLHGGFDDFSM